MESNTYIISIFYTAFREILGIFDAEGIDSSIIGLNGDCIGCASGNSSGYCKRNVFIIDLGRIFSCYSNDADIFQRVFLQITDISYIGVRTGSNSTFEINRDCRHINVY